jgi:type IV pilus assembly protein PilY1
MYKKIAMSALAGLLVLSATLMFPAAAAAYTASDFAAVPPFITAGSPPLVLLVLGRDHKLYYEAYNDASDLDGDGDLDVGFQPSIEYYGYFDSYKCYSYNSTAQRYDPVRVTADGKCGGSGEWAGNWLNYVTTTRMDAMRKVLYGGYRSTDTDTDTILERAYVPRDAHGWGKEYESVARDGYDITEYTPFTIPTAGTRHLFACTSLYDAANASYQPLLRTMPNNTHRIWEWVSKERPVVDDSLVTGGGRYEGYPANHAEFDALVALYGTAAHLQGSGTPSPKQINGTGNPYGADDYYLNIFTGTLRINTAGTYYFAVDGDDAEEVIIDSTVVAGYYGAHGACNCTTHSGSKYLTAGDHVIEFRHQERSGGDSYYLWWKGPDSGNSWVKVPATAFPDLTQTVYDVQSGGSTITDYVVRVKVGLPSMPEANTKLYPNGSYKPIGILQRHGESNEMFFGLITGSYAKNLKGGVLRKNIGPITDEIDANTGQITAVNGIIKTLNKLRIYRFGYSDYSYANCGWIATTSLSSSSDGKCGEWGNPIAEMMYEGMRYYSGAGSATPDFTYTTGDDIALGLPLATWQNPFDVATGYAHCAKPFMLVISDINPSYDSDQLPGSHYSSFSGTLGSLNVATLTTEIGNHEGLSGQFYIGDSNGFFDTACSAKTVTELGKIRGLCPEEPTKQGSYYSAAVAYYGHRNDLNSASGEQKVTTYAVGLSSPLPRIEIPIGTQTITLVPFAKSVGGYSINSNRGYFQPTNTIVDFYVQEITPVYGKFRINYEDVEQGADHDMDAIIIYEYQIVDGAGNPVTVANIADGVAVNVTLTSEYAAGSIIQHCGYVISGTDNDGSYLEVRDNDTASTSDVDYFLDTPPGVGPNTGPGDTAWDDNVALPLVATRQFRPQTGATAATLIENPLYYAAKWGGFEDSNGNNIPDLTSEWDKDGNGLPDTYFYVVNPLELEKKLNESFASILERTSSGTAASVISGSRTGEGALYQALFYPSLTDSQGNKVNWTGELYSMFVDHYGNFREDTNGNAVLDMIGDRIVHLFFDDVANQTKARFYYDTDGDGLPDGSGTLGSLKDIKTIWDGGQWLAEAAATASRDYQSTTKSRRIFTWLDQNQNGLVSDDGVADGNESSAAETMLFDPAQAAQRQAIAPYLMAKAMLTTAFGGHRDLEYTATFPGAGGNAISIAYVNPGANYSTTTVTVSGTAITVNLRTNAFAQTVATAAEVLGSVSLDAAASSLVTVKLPQSSAGEGIVTVMAATNLSLDAGTRKLMEYVIGQDKDFWRNRQIETKSGSVRNWKLGDIVYSTPSVVGQPAEDFDLIYGDPTYFNYRQAFRNRRQVVYVGSNDGMLHAFNAGFWDRMGRQFLQSKETDAVTWDSGTKQYVINYGALDTPTSWDLGAELWSYIPQAVLPHLQWLTDREYPHVYMVDLKPKSTDIKFADGQWRTILICGLRLGGQDITTVDDFNQDGTPAETRTFTSEIFALDVTDPENPPKLLWSFTHPDLGLTTSYPTIVRMEDKWYVVVGSGPSGALATQGYSDQTGRVFVLNAETGTMARTSPFVVTESASFMADPIAVDVDLSSYDADTGTNYDIRWSHELAYIGTTYGSAGAWGGKMYRLRFRDSKNKIITDPNLWTMGLFMDAAGPISSAPNATKDILGNIWLYFGTGRFWSVADKAECLAACAVPTSTACQTCENTSRRWFYGVTEPRDSYGELTWGTVTRTNLLDTSNFKVYEGGHVDTNGDGTIDKNFGELVQQVKAAGGWRLQFEDVGERSSYQPVVLGGIVAFTTYIPSTDVCDFEGRSNLYALYYLTGTAYSSSVIGLGGDSTDVDGTPKQEVLKKVDLGTGVGTAPTVHIGADSKVMIQSSTGAIITVEQVTANNVKSGLRAWKEEF